ncbi:uncharacterized protein Fot_12707 [Forsythia ovata]|uniref:Uncharacterized protein n=1 Tax=Forsythia ovata TaxID=205694 RepID=A0ABD1W1F9_9LAMI
MNHDEKFQQIWEFRRREDDIDSSSDDSKSNSSREPVHKKHKLVSDIVLPENDEVSDTPRSQWNSMLHTNSGIHSQNAEGIKKRTTTYRKKNVVQNKTRRCSIKEKKKGNGNLRSEEMVMLDDFKNFTDSLIDELKVAREKIFAQMRDEMRKLLSSRSYLRPKKKVDCSRKNESRPKRRSESRKKSKSNVVSDTIEFPKVVEDVNHDKVLEVTTTHEPNKGKGSGLPTTKADLDQIVSSSYLSLPTVLPNPQLRSEINDIPLNDHIQPATASNIPSSEIESGEILNGKSNHLGFPGFRQEEQFGGFSHLSSKTIGFRGLHCSQTSSIDIGFPFPLLQGLDNSTNISSQTFSENSFMDNSIVTTRSNSGIMKFSGGSSAMSECSLVNSISSHMKYKTDGELASVRTQDLKDGRFYLN